MCNSFSDLLRYIKLSSESRFVSWFSARVSFVNVLELQPMNPVRNSYLKSVSRCMELRTRDLRDLLCETASRIALNYSSVKLIESRLRLRRQVAPWERYFSNIGPLILTPQLVIWEILSEWRPVNLLKASEKPGRERSGTKHRLSSLSFLVLAISNIVSEKFLSAMFTNWRLLKFFRYLWNLISQFSVLYYCYPPVAAVTGW